MDKLVKIANLVNDFFKDFDNEENYEVMHYVGYVDHSQTFISIVNKNRSKVNGGMVNVYYVYKNGDTDIRSLTITGGGKDHDSHEMKPFLSDERLDFLTKFIKKHVNFKMNFPKYIEIIFKNIELDNFKVVNERKHIELHDKKNNLILICLTNGTEVHMVHLQTAGVFGFVRLFTEVDNYEYIRKYCQEKYEISLATSNT